MKKKLAFFLVLILLLITSGCTKNPPAETLPEEPSVPETTVLEPTTETIISETEATVPETEATDAADPEETIYFIQETEGSDYIPDDGSNITPETSPMIEVVIPSEETSPETLPTEAPTEETKDSSTETSPEWTPPIL